MDLEGLISGIVSSRHYFLKHLRDMPEAAWTFKPYPECKSALETLVHLRIDDDTAVESIMSKADPDYIAATLGSYEEIEKGSAYLLERLENSHRQLTDVIRSDFSGKDLDTEICVWGDMKPLYRGVPYFSSEDFYHSGQIAFIRMAVQPEWNYYADIYGEAYPCHNPLQ